MTSFGLLCLLFACFSGCNYRNWFNNFGLCLELWCCLLLIRYGAIFGEIEFKGILLIVMWEIHSYGECWIACLRGHQVMHQSIFLVFIWVWVFSSFVCVLCGGRMGLVMQDIRYPSGGRMGLTMKG